MNLARINVLAAKNYLRKLPQVELPTEHFIADGMYCRRLFRRKGVMIGGRVHKLEHFYIVASGCVSVSSGGGKDVLHQAGDVIISSPGTERLVWAMVDSVCITVHRISDMPNWKTATLEEIENFIAESDPNSMYGVGNTLKELPCHLQQLPR